MAAAALALSVLVWALQLAAKFILISYGAIRCEPVPGALSHLIYTYDAEMLIEYALLSTPIWVGGAILLTALRWRRQAR